MYRLLIFKIGLVCFSLFLDYAKATGPIEFKCRGPVIDNYGSNTSECLSRSSEQFFSGSYAQNS